MWPRVPAPPGAWDAPMPEAACPAWRQSSPSTIICCLSIACFTPDHLRGPRIVAEDSMQYIYTMNGVSKTVPPRRPIIKDISLSFFPGAKIGLLGLNGAGKSTVLRIMAGVDDDYQGEARPQPGIKIGYLAQEPELDPDKTVRETVEEGVGEVLQAQARLEEVYAAYAEEGADFEKLAEEQQRLENLLQAQDAQALEKQLDQAA